MDTSIAIPLLRGEPGLSDRFREARELLLPAPALGELIFGVLCSIRTEESVRRIEWLERECTLIPCDAVVARRFAEFKWALRQKGTPIPENDIWIAACAVAWNVPLLARDDHFSLIDTLVVVRW